MIYESNQTLPRLLTPEISVAAAGTIVEWCNTSYEDVVKAANATPSVEPTEFTSRAYVLEPDSKDFDETKSVVLALPHLNGWTPHHYIRARVMQQIVCPNNRVIVFPNNSFGQSNYDVNSLEEKQKAKLQNGSMAPIAAKHLRTLEGMDKHLCTMEGRDKTSSVGLGAIALSGYSLGGNTVLSMAVLGSDSLEITHVNADEAPSKVGRDAAGVQKDFMKSGGLGDLRAAVKDSDIDALSSAMRLNRMVTDLAKFGLKSLSRDGKLLRAGMSDSIGLDLMSLSKYPDLMVKIGYIEGSEMFDPLSVDGRSSNFDLVHYRGEGFHKHASADNVILHALMANDGINPSTAR